MELIKRYFRNGISLIVPTQNSILTIEMCLESFYDFADEIIVVDNGSTDGTVEFLEKYVQDKDKISFYNRPELPDLHHNRNAAFQKTKYKWVMRIDSDYIAYNDGDYDIMELRNHILSQPFSLWPMTMTVMNVTLFHNAFLTGKPKSERNAPNQGRYAPETVAFMPARIIQRYPFMKFQRNGRWEGIRFQRYLKRIKLDIPYWLHCEFKSDKIDYLFRSERTNWRELGDFKTYPTLASYVDHIIEDKYNTTDHAKAADIYFNAEIAPVLMEYKEVDFYPYPSLLKHNIEKGLFHDAA